MAHEEWLLGAWLKHSVPSAQYMEEREGLVFVWWLYLSGQWIRQLKPAVLGSIPSRYWYFHFPLSVPDKAVELEFISSWSYKLFEGSGVTGHAGMVIGPFNIRHTILARCIMELNKPVNVDDKCNRWLSILLTACEFHALSNKCHFQGEGFIMARGLVGVCIEQMWSSTAVELNRCNKWLKNAIFAVSYSWWKCTAHVNDNSGRLLRFSSLTIIV